MMQDPHTTVKLIKLWVVVTTAMALVHAAQTAACAAEPPDQWPGTRSLWHGYDRYDFEVNGLKCHVVVPRQASAGMPWVWRASFPEYHPEVDLALLDRGYHVAFINVVEFYGSPKAVTHGDDFYELLTGRHGLARRPALEGVSRGGLFVFNWAAKNPDKVACIYNEVPVCDFKSWPRGKDQGAWKRCLDAYGFDDESKALAYDKNPIDNLEPLALRKIPVLHVVSENDRVVPSGDNTYRLKERYEKLGGDVDVISVPEGTAESMGHHFAHPDPDAVVGFIVRYSQSGE